MMTATRTLAHTGVLPLNFQLATLRILQRRRPFGYAKAELGYNRQLVR